MVLSMMSGMRGRVNRLHEHAAIPLCQAGHVLCQAGALHRHPLRHSAIHAGTTVTAPFLPPPVLLPSAPPAAGVQMGLAAHPGWPAAAQHRQALGNACGESHGQVSGPGAMPFSREKMA